MIAFIDVHRDAYGVEPICAVLPIALSSYYEAKARESDPERLPPRAKRDAQLRPEIERVWHENFRVYGVRKIWRQLDWEAILVPRCTVARLMGELGLRCVVRGRRAKTMLPARAAPCPQDRVQRTFTVSQPNALWVSDLTYVAT